MKVLDIRPGTVSNDGAERWTYSIEYVRSSGSHFSQAGVAFCSAAAAKPCARKLTICVCVMG